MVTYRMGKLTASAEMIAGHILMVRGQRVMIDHDLARLYKVPTKALNQAVKRNAARFPSDFMFQLNAKEKNEVVTNCYHLRRLRFSPVLPYVFTEHGALMLANVLNSLNASEMSLSIVRAFVRLREILVANKDLAYKLIELERKIGKHDEAIRNIVAAIRQMMNPPLAPPIKPKGPIGFQP
jgi:hypothetical protein